MKALKVVKLKFMSIQDDPFLVTQEDMINMSVQSENDHSIWIILGVGVVVISGILLYDHFCNSESFKSTYDDHDQN